MRSICQVAEALRPVLAVSKHVAVAITSRMWLRNIAVCRSLAQVRPQASFDTHLFRAMSGTSCQHCWVCGQAFEPIQGESKLCCTTVTMYHGTTTAAAEQIERHGFRPSTGGTLGPGVYASRDIEKARGYNRGALFELSVNVGKVVCITGMHSMRTTWQSHGYDSAWIPPNCRGVGSGLEESCIRDPGRIRVVRRV